MHIFSVFDHLQAVISGGQAVHIYLQGRPRVAGYAADDARAVVQVTSNVFGNGISAPFRIVRFFQS